MLAWRENINWYAQCVAKAKPLSKTHHYADCRYSPFCTVWTTSHQRPVPTVRGTRRSHFPPTPDPQLLLPPCTDRMPVPRPGRYRYVPLYCVSGGLNVLVLLYGLFCVPESRSSEDLAQAAASTGAVRAAWGNTGLYSGHMRSGGVT